MFPPMSFERALVVTAFCPSPTQTSLDCDHGETCFSECPEPVCAQAMLSRSWL